MDTPFRPTARERTVIEIEFNRGTGTLNDPVRRVIAYHDPDGTLLAERDSGLLNDADWNRLKADFEATAC